ncbi:MAG: type I glyceraldehyde-3-phosphate dehydrogenase [Cyanobacteria bacterium P01_H01_bin.74]
MTKIAINGFGRIGRMCLRAALSNSRVDLNIVAINDLTTPEQLAHLFKYDSTMGIYPGEVEANENGLLIDGKQIQVFAEKDPANLPWKKTGVDIVIEATGLFTDATVAKKHIEAGAQKVIISAPAKNEDITLALGINEADYDPTKHHIISNASCTTNCLAPIGKVLLENFGVVSGLMTTIHSYTGDQRLLDAPHRDLRRARSAAQSMIPTSTGAAKAIGLVLPQLKGKLNGFAVRVPTPNVSLTDLTLITEKSVSIESVNAAFKQAANNELKNILEYSDKPLVSRDFVGNPHSCIFDPEFTQVVDDKMLKVIGWYDNEWGYSNRLAELTQMVGERLPVTV